MQAQAPSTTAQQILSNVLTSTASTSTSSTFRPSNATYRKIPLITISSESVPIHELCLQGLERLSSLPARCRPAYINNSTLKDRRLLFVPPVDSRGRAIQGRCWSRKSAQQHAIIQAQAKAQAALLAQHFSSQPSQLSRTPSRHSADQHSNSMTRDMIRSTLHKTQSKNDYHSIHASLVKDSQCSPSKVQAQVQVQTQVHLPSAPSEPKWEFVMSIDDDEEEEEDEEEAPQPSSFNSARRISFSHELPSVLRPGPYSPAIPVSGKDTSEMDYDVDVIVGFGDVEESDESESENESEDSFSSQGSTPPSSSASSDESDEEELDMEMEMIVGNVLVASQNVNKPLQASGPPPMIKKPGFTLTSISESDEENEADYEWKTIDLYPGSRFPSKSHKLSSSPRLRSSPYSSSKRLQQRSISSNNLQIMSQPQTPRLPTPAYLNPSFESSTRPLSRH